MPRRTQRDCRESRRSPWSNDASASSNASVENYHLRHLHLQQQRAYLRRAGTRMLWPLWCDYPTARVSRVDSTSPIVFEYSFSLSLILSSLSPHSLSFLSFSVARVRLVGFGGEGGRGDGRVRAGEQLSRARVLRSFSLSPRCRHDRSGSTLHSFSLISQYRDRDRD